MRNLSRIWIEMEGNAWEWFRHLTTNRFRSWALDGSQNVRPSYDDLVNQVRDSYGNEQ